VGGHGLARLDGRAVALDEVLDDQVGRRRIAGVVEFGLRAFGIEWHRGFSFAAAGG
jgi:hypothetical protein